MTDMVMLLRSTVQSLTTIASAIKQPLTVDVLNDGKGKY
jgi:hypothetical protein